MRRLLLIVLGALLLFAACRKEARLVDLTAVLVDQPGRGSAKVYIDDNRYACWHNGDYVNVNGNEYTLSVEPGTGNHAGHKVAKILEVDESSNGYTAGYPTGCISGITEGGTSAMATVLSVQPYIRAAVYDGTGDVYQQLLNPMIAYCSDEDSIMKFHNVACVLKVTILNSTGYDLDMHFVTVEATSAYLAGSSPVSGIGTNTPAMGKPTSGYHGITVDCSSSPIPLNDEDSTSLYVVSAPFSDQVLTVRVLAKDPDGDTIFYTLKATSAVPLSLSRNQMGQATFEIEECTCKPETDRCNYAFWGCGTEPNPFLITSVDDLTRLQGYMGTSTNATYNNSAVYYRQIKDLDASGSTWTSTNKYFWAHYDGGGYSIKLSLATAGGFVARVYGAEFKNLTLTGTCASTTSSGTSGSGIDPIGAFANYVWNEGGISKFENCTNKIAISRKGSAGGFVGLCRGQATFTNCTNDANVTGHNVFENGNNSIGRYIGGFVGKLMNSVTIDGCINNGAVSAAGRVGGMVGGNDDNYGPLTIKGNTVNNGNISSTTSYCGGILGGGYISFTVASDATVTNNGVINNTSGGYVGGIVGSCRYSACQILGTAINNNTVSSTAGNVGGIIGSVNVVCTIHNAQNNNAGAVTGTGSIGGIVGSGSSGNLEITGSTNSAPITGSQYVGGIVGQYGSTSVLTLTNNTNTATGVLKGNQYVGGMLGGGRKAHITSCVNYATVRNNGSTSGSQIGGIVGQLDNDCDGAYLDHCVNCGSMISGKTSGETAMGGMVGRIYINKACAVTIKNCSNLGDITGKERNGGLVGYKHHSSSYACTLYVYNSFVRCTITGITYTGGILGYDNYSTNRTHLYNTYFDGDLRTGSYSYCCDIGYSIANNSTYFTATYCYAKVGCYSGTNTEHFMGRNGTYTDTPPTDCAYYDGSSGTLYGDNAGSTPTSVSIGGTQTNLGDALRAWQAANSSYTAWNTGNVPTLQ